MSMISDRRLYREPARLILAALAITLWAATGGAAVMAEQYWFATALVVTAAPVVMAWHLGRPHAPVPDDAVLNRSVALRQALEPVNRKPVNREPSRAAR